MLNVTEMGTSEFKHQEVNHVLTNPNTCKPSNSAGTLEAQGQTQVVTRLPPDVRTSADANLITAARVT